MSHPLQDPGPLAGSSANRCTWQSAKASFERLELWLERRQLDWLEDLTIVWLNQAQSLVFEIAGRNTLPEFVEDAQHAARLVIRLEAELHNAAIMKTASRRILGSVAACGRVKEENYLVASLLAELVLDPGVPDEFLQLLAEERFIEHGFEWPDVAYVRTPGNWSQAGLQTYLDTAPCGWPSQLDPPLPQPLPGVELITERDIPGFVPGHGGGLHG